MKPITLGRYNWIGNRSTIKKGGEDARLLHNKYAFRKSVACDTFSEGMVFVFPSVERAEGRRNISL